MSATKKQLLAVMADLRACGEATTWVMASKHKMAAAIWKSCDNPGWLFWLAARAGVDRKAIVSAACLVAREALVHVKPGEDRPRICIETAERWTRGEATIEEVRLARRWAAYADAYAYAAADAAADADADAAAYADAYAADAAAYAYAAAAAAYAYAAADAYAYAAADAAYAAADAAAARQQARKKSLEKSAGLVKSLITWSVVERAIAAQTKVSA